MVIWVHYVEPRDIDRKGTRFSTEAINIAREWSLFNVRDFKMGKAVVYFPRHHGYQRINANVAREENRTPASVRQMGIKNTEQRRRV